MIKKYQRTIIAFLGLTISLLLNFSLLIPISSAKINPPPIIPNDSATQGQQLMIPHDTTTDANSSYLQNRLLPGIASTIIAITGGVALVFAIYSGIQMLTSYGNPAQFDAAKKTFTYALVGIIIGGLSYAIVAIISAINISPSS